MTRPPAEQGFALIEVLIASALTLVVIGAAFSGFRDALMLNDGVVKLTDASQNLRSATNLLVRDLLQTGRNMPIGGISIPSGPKNVVQPVLRPGPTGSIYNFENDENVATTIGSLTTGEQLGPSVAGRRTDMITLLVDDPFQDSIDVAPDGTAGSVPKLNSTGSAFTVGTQTAWLTGDPANGIPPVAPGDLMYFLNSRGTTLQTVTKVDATGVYFESGAGDLFTLNQRAAPAGSITPLLGVAMTVRRVLMLTYFVQETTPGQPRLMRRIGFGKAQALAGVVEDLQFQYDLVDGSSNPANVNELPITINGVTYTSSQIRKVTVNVGVRSETQANSTGDYMRHHVSTVVSLRNLAFVDRYN